MISTTIGNYDDPASIGSKLRRRRSGPLCDLIDAVYCAKGSCSILDLGGTERYWNILGEEFLHERNCEVVLLNQTAISVRRSRIFRAEVGDACAVDAKDDAFDIVHSNSVIEHVGGWQRARAFSIEARRLAPNYFVQTPNFWFPWEPHFGFPFFQMLPIPLRARLLLRGKRGFYRRCESVSSAIEIAESIRLLDCRMIRELFPDARILRERFLGLTKSFVAIRDRTAKRRPK
jgi:hypothetical protein